ncbi:ABC transporter permease [Chloroflexi bacterium TSY]|nr:ABC transporter permease [Chloroflexi bacterium TSY]
MAEETSRKSISLPWAEQEHTEETLADPFVDELDDVKVDRVYVASQWRLMWWRFRKHKLAMLSVVITLGLYMVAIFAEFFAIADPHEHDARLSFIPPQTIHWFDEGQFSPFVYGLKGGRDPRTLRMVYEIDEAVKYPVRFFVHGHPYKLLGIFPADIHLMGLDTDDEEAPFYPFGSDRLGRDMWSRMAYGTRISMSIGFVGVVLSLIFGIVLGGLSGYYGGMIDTVIQRIIEFIRSLPTIPFWLSLAAALPRDWPPLRTYFMITVILSIFGWTGLARVVRGRFLSLREEDFVMAARLGGTGEMRIIFRHMVPSFMSHIIATITLAIPAMILSETSLSFLGLGLRPPVISWGVLLQEAQNIQSVALAPWLLAPGLAVVVSVLSFNFLGDGLRDAADPYAQ